MLFETFIPKLAVEALDKRILHRFPRLNEAQMYPVLRSPDLQNLSGKFVAAIQGKSRELPTGDETQVSRYV